MLIVLILVLIILWFLGYVSVGDLNIPDITLFTLNGQVISLWDLLILGALLWAVSILPTPLRQIAGVGLILWVLATLGIIALAGLPSLIVIAIILGLVVSMFS